MNKKGANLFRGRNLNDSAWAGVNTMGGVRLKWVGCEASTRNAKQETRILCRREGVAHASKNLLLLSSLVQFFSGGGVSKSNG